MKPTQVLWEAMVNQIGSTTVTFDALLANQGHFWLVKTPFTPGLALSLNTVDDKATFPGVTPLTNTGAAIPALIDPLTGRLVLQINLPAGGLVWVCGADPSEPETIYGMVYSDSSTTFNAPHALASCLLPEPLTITNAGQFVEVDDSKLTFNPAMVS